MATRIDEILEGARDLLADELPAARWDNAKLIRFLNEGYIEAVLTNKLLKDVKEFFIRDDSRYIILPDDILLPTRITYNGRKISFLTHQDLDNQTEEHSPASLWECNEGSEPQALIFDLQNRRKGTIYPILRNIKKSLYTVTPDTLGVLLTIGAVDASDPFGVVVTTSDSVKEDGFVSPVFGVAVGADDRGVLAIYYDKKPGKITSVNSIIETDSSFDVALKYYVIHMALAADMDTMDNRMSEKYLGLYLAKISKAKKDSALGYTIGDTHTDYAGFV